MISPCRPRVVLATLVLTAAIFAGGCWWRSGPEVIVYSALDSEFSEPILNDFAAASGIRVLAKYDVESTKTVGLASAIIHEQNRPRCDVFWNNEILHTLRLQKLGLLDVYLTPAADPFPAGSRSSDGQWFGLAARARVLIVNTDLLPDERQWPRSIEDLADPKWRGRMAIAKPLAGTTATHAAVLFAAWGDERAEEFFRQVKANTARPAGTSGVLSGNKQVARAVADGQFAFGITDTDDAVIERDEARPVAIIFPDQGDSGMGTLQIPNTLCIIKHGPNPVAARQLVDYLLSPPVEQRLAAGRSAQFPLNPQVTERSRVAPEIPVKWMSADFSAAADKWDTAATFLRDEFAAVD